MEKLPKPEPLKVGEFSGTADWSMEGRIRRLGAVRAFIRYRNPETGKRAHCHERTYRAAFIEYVKALRAAVMYPINL